MKLRVFAYVFFTGSHNNSGKNTTSGSALAGRLFVVIGAGGASKALAYGAKQRGARLVIANRTYGSLLFLFHCSSTISVFSLHFHLDDCFCLKCPYIISRNYTITTE